MNRNVLEGILLFAFFLIVVTIGSCHDMEDQYQWEREMQLEQQERIVQKMDSMTEKLNYLISQQEAK